MTALEQAEKPPVVTVCMNPRCRLKISQPRSYPVGGRLYCDETCGRRHRRDVDRAARAMDEEGPYEPETQNLMRHVQRNWGVGSKTFNK